MTTKEAIEVLTHANLWRRYNGGTERPPKMPDSSQFGLAIDHAIEVLKRFEGAVEVEVGIEDFEINVKSESMAEQAKIYMILAEDKVEIKLTISETHKLYAIPKEKNND